MDNYGDMNRNDGKQVAFDALAGALAGAAAVWVMDRVDWFMYSHEDPSTRAQTKEARPGGIDPAHVMAQKITSGAGRQLEPAQPNAAGIGIHYSLGIGPGALYSVLVDRYPFIGTGRGLLFGFGLFLAQDELLNSAMGLAGRPGEYPPQDHARGLISHLVYGFTMDAGVRVLKRMAHDASDAHFGSRADEELQERMAYQARAYDSDQPMSQRAHH